ncbi:hypothetical protein ELI04_04360 [Rhizobium leguminosarum]|nr:hypothetical protein ELI04_04360 [Rhizobium leguminosarum]
MRHIPFSPRAGRRCRQADEGHATHRELAKRAPKRPSTSWFSSPSTGTDASALPRARPSW